MNKLTVLIIVLKLNVWLPSVFLIERPLCVQGTGVQVTTVAAEDEK